MPVGSPDGRHPEEQRSWLKDSSPEKHLIWLRWLVLPENALPVQKNALSGSDRLVLPENALPDTTAVAPLIWLR